MARLFLVVLLILTTVLVEGSGPSPIFKVYPLADDYFEKVYLVSHTNGQYYLTISCKQRDMLSISLTQKKDFQEQPRFNVYGDKHPKPKMGTGTYSMLRECQTEVVVNTSHIVEVRRTNGDIIFAINNATFDNMHNSFKVVDHSVKWGLGERFQKNFKVIDGKWTLWNRDKPWKIDQGMVGISDQTYGFQPVYLARNRENKLHHLVYFKNTFGLLIEVEKNSSELMYNSIGGPIHFIILVGQEDPEQLLERYH